MSYWTGEAGQYWIRIGEIGKPSLISNLGWDTTTYQQNVNQLSRHTESSQTLRAISTVFLSTCKYSQTPIELGKMCSSSARVFSYAPESRWSYGGAFKMLQDLADRIVTLWTSWDLSADLGETSRLAKTAAQPCRSLGEWPRELQSTAGDLVTYSRSGVSYTAQGILFYQIPLC
jgi:hypothetical protein